MQLKTINFEGDLEDAEREDLVDAINQFQKAQEENAAEFEAAKEQITDALGDDTEFDDVFGEVQDFADAKADLIETITEYDSFEESPVTETVLERSDFDDLREYDAYFADLDTDEDEDGEFGDMGSKAPTSPEEDEEEADAEFARKHLGGMPGFQRSD